MERVRRETQRIFNYAKWGERPVKKRREVW